MVGAVLLRLRQTAQRDHDIDVVHFVSLVDTLSGGQFTHHTTGCHSRRASENFVFHLGKDVAIYSDPDLEMVTTLRIPDGSYPVGVVDFSDVSWMEEMFEN